MHAYFVNDVCMAYKYGPCSSKAQFVFLGSLLLSTEMIWILCVAVLAIPYCSAKTYMYHSRPGRARSLNFLAVGDWGGQPNAPYYTIGEKKVAAAMGLTAFTIASQFTITVGDNFYQQGVKDVNDPRFRTTFEV